MATLPFVVQPRRQPILERVGSEESGQIEIERRGYLTAGEKSFVQQVQQFDNGTTEIVKVSRRVARKHGLGMDKAYNLVLGIISNSSTKEDDDLVGEIEEEFAEDLANVIKSLSVSQVREELVMAACLLRYRVNPDYEIADISTVHPDLINGLAKLYREEEARSIEAFKTKEDEEEASKAVSVEEAEKKPVKTTASRSKTSTGD
jgi:hypothetical protein